MKEWKMQSQVKVVLGLAALALAGLGPGLKAQEHAPRQPIARIAQEPIYDEDLAPLISGQMLQLKNQEYELKTRALDTLISQRLLEREAKAKELSADAYLDRAVYQTLPPVSVPEIEAYYLAQKNQINRPLNEVRAQIEQTLLQAKRQQARQSFLDQLRHKADVSILLSHPKVEVAIDAARLRGNARAAVTIVEFADFQCPYCQAAEETVKQVLQKYKASVRLAFRDFPLTQIHPQALQAAQASRCAGEQGKYWEYHDLLFANRRLDPAGLKESARMAGMDVERFGSCLSSEKFNGEIENDLRIGTAAGVTGTPAFYINGVSLSGAVPASEFENIIDSELAKARDGGAAQ
jgi:protein-disulfide isomerase